MNEPDWNIRSISLGGHLEDFPHPLVYQWPNKHGVKRRVTITLNTWVGVGMGATHYYIRIEEEDNRAWNGKVWARAWDHKEKKGRNFEEEFLFPYQCKDFAHEMIAKYFNDGSYEIEWHGLETHHLYKREGD